MTPDGKYALSASKDGALKRWDLISGEELATLQGHTDQITAVAVTPDGKYAVSASHDQTLKLWDLINGCELATFTGEAFMTSVGITSAGSRLIAGDAQGRVHILDITG